MPRRHPSATILHPAPWPHTTMNMFIVIGPHLRPAQLVHYPLLLASLWVPCYEAQMCRIRFRSLSQMMGSRKHCARDDVPEFLARASAHLREVTDAETGGVRKSHTEATSDI